MKIVLNLSYFASIMLNVFRDLLCSKLCWYNRPGPRKKCSLFSFHTITMVFLSWIVFHWVLVIFAENELELERLMILIICKLST